MSNARGFKGSALDSRPVYALVPIGNVTSSPEETRLDPESLDVWEIGYKGAFRYNRIQLDAAAFLYTYEDLQQFATTRGIPILDNAPEPEIKGFDANIEYGGGRGLFIQAGISLLDTEVTEVGDSTFVEGAKLANSPEISLNLLASQEFYFGNGSLFAFTTNVSHTGDQVKVTATNGNSGAVDQLSSDAYTLPNANASYRFGEEQQWCSAASSPNSSCAPSSTRLGGAPTGACSSP